MSLNHLSCFQASGDGSTVRTLPKSFWSMTSNQWITKSKKQACWLSKSNPLTYLDSTARSNFGKRNGSGELLNNQNHSRSTTTLIDSWNDSEQRWWKAHRMQNKNTAFLILPTWNSTNSSHKLVGLLVGQISLIIQLHLLQAGVSFHVALHHFFKRQTYKQVD